MRTRPRIFSRREEIPVTNVGRWLRAVVLDDDDERDRLVHYLADGEWEPDEPAVFEALCEILLPICFPPDNRDDIATLLDWLQSRSAEIDSEQRLVLEQVIDIALKRADPSVVADVPRQAAVMRGIVLAAIGMRHRFDPAFVNRSIAEAERRAIERGFQPAPRRSSNDR